MYIVFDIGGTKMRLAVSHDGESIEPPTIIPTPSIFDEAVERFRESVRNLSCGKKVDAISGGIRGPLNRDKSTLISEIYLTDWVGRPIRETFTNVCAAPVYLQNDTSLVGLGEAMVGAGQGGRIVGYMTISTGVGGVRIVGGKIDQTSVGFEPGKQIIDIDKSLCPDCIGNTLEEYVSGGAVEKRFGKPPKEISSEKVWDELAGYLAVGVSNTIVHWSPDVMVLGGRMITGNPAISVEKVALRVKEILTVFPEPPRIVKASLEDVGGLHGALVYIRQQLQKE